MKKIVFVFAALAVLLGAAQAQDAGAPGAAADGAPAAESPAESSGDAAGDAVAENPADAAESANSGAKKGWLHPNDGKKHYFTAISEVAVFNVGLSLWNRYMIGSGWSKVGWHEWDHFWWRRLAWDDDWYWTNFVLHPYQGSLYYMAARGSNLNMAEAFALTVIGDAAWEYLCETNAPSKNDIIYTSVGAFVVGEMLYRLSLNADEVSDVYGILLNPTRLWTQLWTRQKPLGTSHNIHELTTRLAVGSTQTHTDLMGYRGRYTPNEVYPVFFSPEVYVAYNDPYGHDSNTPYSQFELLGRFAGGVGSGYGSDCQYADLDKQIMYEIRIESNGMLFSRAPKLGERTDTTVGLSMEYDFDWHSFYQLTALSPCLAIKQRVRYDPVALEWQAHLGWNLCGTTDYYYYHRNLVEPETNTSRTYSYTFGPQMVLKFRMKSESGMSLNLGFRGYMMYDFYNQLQKHSSVGFEWIGIGTGGIEFPVSKRMRLGLTDEIYVKRAFYKSVNDVFQVVNTGGVYAKWQIK